MQTSTVPIRPSRPTRDARPAAPGGKAGSDTRVHHWAQAASRMLVATFFIATSVSNMGEAEFGFGGLAIAESSLIFNAMIYSMAFAVLIGRYMHIAALLLALALLWTSTAEVTGGTQDLASYWQDLAIVGALFFMAAQSGSQVSAAFGRAMARGRTVTPRRVAPGRRAGDSAAEAPLHPSRHHVARPVAMPMFASRRDTLSN